MGRSEKVGTLYKPPVEKYKKSSTLFYNLETQFPAFSNKLVLLLVKSTGKWVANGRKKWIQIKKKT